MKDLKQLQVLYQKYKDELIILRAEVARLNTEINFKQSTLSSIHKEISDLIKEPSVSEHAIIRYFERVLGINIEDIKSTIMPEETIKQIKTLGDGKYPVKDFYIICKQNSIVTILTEEKTEL